MRVSTLHPSTMSYRIRAGMLTKYHAMRPIVTIAGVSPESKSSVNAGDQEIQVLRKGDTRRSRM